MELFTRTFTNQSSKPYGVETDTTRLWELSYTVGVQVSEIQRCLLESGQQHLTFEGRAKPTDFSGIEDVRSAVLENLTELQELLLTPQELLHAYAPTNLSSRHACDRFNIYQAIPVDGSKTYEELASITLLPVKIVRRIVRHAMSQRVFYEPEPGVVAHTQASRLLAEDSKVRDYFGTVCQEVWPAATRTADAIEKWPGSKERYESAYQLAHDRTIYETLALYPDKQARYDNAMGAFSNDRSFSIENVTNGYDWAGLGEGTVVDIGGGIGTVSIALATAFPKLHFVVQDRPDVIGNAVVEDADIKNRIKFMEHDFFQEQPIKHADVYFFRWVLMEWSDEKAVEIIKALKPALKVGAVVVIVDFYVPDPGTCPIWQERKFRNRDLLALALGNAGSKDLEECRDIFKHAGPGFEFKGVRLVPNTDNAFIEAVWQGEVELKDGSNGHGN